MRTIDADALKKYKFTTQIANGVELEDIEVVPVAAIDNAPTVCNDNYSMGYQDGVKKVLSERPTGKWIEHYDSSDGFTWLTCSRCMFKAYEDDYKFCPNCGADMRVKDELRGRE